MAQAAQPLFVGCPADGMSGPVPAPSTPPFPVPDLHPVLAARLAFYAAPGLAVLAPRGWHCLDLYDSGGAYLLVTPRAYTASTLPAFGTLAGPAIELNFLNGENSGRTEVARVFARLFPAKRRFVRAVIAGEYEAAHAYPNRPYPTDTTVRRGRVQVAYTTPPRHAGMGTFDSRLRPGPQPITGTATLATANGTDSVVLLNVRLPRGLRALVPPIMATARAGSS